MPGATPVITPLASTVATEVFELDHVPFMVTVLPVVQFEELPDNAKLFNVPFAGAPLI